MEVKKLQARIEDFKVYLKKDKQLTALYKWEALNHFQKNWDIDAADFAMMYDQSLRSTYTQRLWKRETWRPKEIMLQLIRLEPDFARKSFRHLFDENGTIESRISMFKFACEELLREFKNQNKTTIENNHYHDDNEMVLLYLSFRHPEQYTFFEYAPFINTLQQLGIQDLPDPYNLERFFKLAKIMHTFLKKDQELLDIHRNRLPKHLHHLENSRLIVHDFYCFHKNI